MSNVVLAMAVAMTLPLVTGEIVPAGARGAIDKERAAAYCAIGWEEIEAGVHRCA